MNSLHHLVVSIGLLLSPIFGVHISAYGTYPAPIPSPTAHVLFGGDMMFDRTIRFVADQRGGDYIFSCLDPVLKHADLVVANLEGPITDQPSRSFGSVIDAPDNYIFTFPTSTAPLLYAHGVRMVNLGNNHIGNFDINGIRSTIRALRDAGVAYFGDPLAQTVATTSIRGVSLAFVNYNQFSPSSTASTTIAQIRAAKAAGRVAVVYTHWGEEYLPATPQQRNLAHRFVDAGADLVIGSHPHVVQAHEVYRGKYVYYSLGNLIFDQYWDDAVRHGLILDVAFTKESVASVSEIPVVLQRDRKTCRVE